jgi:hypothetical protein
MTADVRVLAVEAACPVRGGLGDCMGPFAEVAAAVGVRGEVTPEGVVAEELDELAATRALARPVP